MNRLFKKKTYFALIYAFLALATEIISFAVMKIGVFPEYWGLDVAFVLAFAMLIFMIPSPTASIVVAGVLLVLQTVIACVNEALMTMSGMVFSLTMLNLMKEVGGVFSGDFVNWWLLVGLVALCAAGICSLVFIDKKMPTPKTRFNKSAIIVLLVCCLIGENASLLIYEMTVGSIRSVVASDLFSDDEYLYTSQFITAKALRKFGSFGFYFMNVSNTVDSLLTGISGGIQISEQRELAELDEYFASGTMSEEVYGDNAYTGALSGKNIVLIVIESGEWFAINEEYTPTLYSMAKNGISFTNYYARNKTNHSEAMSILGSYPKESSVSGDLKNSELSFTLPNLLRAASYTTNYFHANKGEFYDRNVTHGAGGAYGFDTAHFPENMPETKGYKNPNKKFYDFDKDTTIAKYYYDEYVYKKEEDSAFFTMHMTLSSHGDYEDLIDNGDYTADLSAEEKKSRSSKYVVKDFEKYYELIDGYPSTFVSPELSMDKEYIASLSESLQKKVYLRYKRLQAGLMDLDEAVNELVYKLDSEGKLDDTAFFFYADHTAYYNSQNYYMKGVADGNYWDSSLYKIPCFLWYGGSMDGNFVPASGSFYEGYHNVSFTAKKDVASPLSEGKIEKFVNSFDIVPTLLQLVGYDYNLNLYHGASMFSEEESVFVSLESGIFTDKYYFDGTTLAEKNDSGTWTLFDYESTLDENGFSSGAKEFLTKSKRYYEKQAMLEKMYKLDYFAKRQIFQSHDGTYYVRKVK